MIGKYGQKPEKYHSENQGKQGKKVITQKTSIVFQGTATCIHKFRTCVSPVTFCCILQRGAFC